MVELTLTAIYFFLPAYVANACPVIFGKLKFPGNIPINKKLFGDHKSWRGFYTAYLGALLVLVGQMYLQHYGYFTDFTLLNYTEINLLLFAFLFGIGALTGDLLKSFAKRRIGIKPGGVFFPFDQIDLILGSSLFLLPFFVVPLKIFIAALIITPILHFLTNVLAYFVGLKKVWW